MTIKLNESCSMYSRIEFKCNNEDEFTEDERNYLTDILIDKYASKLFDMDDERLKQEVWNRGVF